MNSFYLLIYFWVQITLRLCFNWYVMSWFTGDSGHFQHERLQHGKKQTFRDKSVILIFNGFISYFYLELQLLIFLCSRLLRILLLWGEHIEQNTALHITKTTKKTSPSPKWLRMYLILQHWLPHQIKMLPRY